MIRTSWRFVGTALLVLACFITPHKTAAAQPINVLAEASTPAPDAERPKIALVLSGGGALGFAHVGVIKVLEEQGIRPDFVVGSSMGAVVGGLYASGYSASQLERLVTDIDWESIFNDGTPRRDTIYRRKRDDDGFLVDARIGIRDGEARVPSGLIQGQQLTLQLRELLEPVTKVAHFDDLPIPFRAVATDIVTGEAVVLDSGNLASALRASMSVPAAFPPVEIDGRLLVDGGLANNLPIDVARDMGADVVIAVQLLVTPPQRPDIQTVFDVLSQSVSLLIIQNEEAQLRTLRDTDVLIQPDLGPFSSSSFFAAEQLVGPGEAAARAVVDQLNGMPSGMEPLRLATAQPVISFVEIDNQSPLSTDVLRRRLDIPLGEPLDPDDLNRQISRLYGLDIFDLVDYQIVNRDGQTGLRILALERGTGLTSLRFGLNLENDFTGQTAYNLGAELTVFGVNSLGAEWRNKIILGDTLAAETEFYQPLSTAQTWFVDAGMSYNAFDVPVFDTKGERTAEYRVQVGEAQVGFGYQFDVWGAIGVGYRAGFGNARVETGDPSLPEQDVEISQFFGGFDIDRLDNLSFPRQGFRVSSEYSVSREGIGADTDYGVLKMDGIGTQSWDRNTVFAGANVQYIAEGVAPIQETARLGGFLNLSGFAQGEVSGPNALVGRLGYYRQLTEKGASSIDLPIYAGATFEAGQAFDTREEFRELDLTYGGSVFVGVDTFLGPLYLAYGHAEGGNQAGYLFLGQTF